MIARIVVLAVDSWKLTLAALRRGIDMAAMMHVPVSVLNLVKDQPPGLLDLARDRGNARGVTTLVEIDPVKALAELEELGAGGNCLLVIGTQPRRQPVPIAFGILEHFEAPVLFEVCEPNQLPRDASEEPEMKAPHIVVGLDGGIEGNMALRCAIDLAAGSQGDLEAIHVKEAQRPVLVQPPARYLHVASSKQIPLVFRGEDAVSVEVGLCQAMDEGGDLLVISSRGRDREGSGLLGPHAKNLISTAHYPVIVCPVGA